MQAQLNTYTSIDGYELFRRAIVDGDELAWAEGVTRYRALLVYWANRCAVSAAISERGDDIADQAISRAWAALSPERFEGFPNLATVMAYLRTCVASTVIDYARVEQSARRTEHAIEVGNVATPEQIAVAQCEQQALWKIVGGLVQSEQERVVLLETFVYDQPPRAVLARYPQFFANVAEVYNVKRNLFERLKRCPELKQMHQERYCGTDQRCGAESGARRSCTRSLLPAAGTIAEIQ